MRRVALIALALLAWLLVAAAAMALLALQANHPRVLQLLHGATR
ncbi:hypothetical protein [Melaminivora sp.]|nr:hypothetical protein [Melaminivora sp.]